MQQHDVVRVGRPWTDQRYTLGQNEFSLSLQLATTLFVLYTRVDERERGGNYRQYQVVTEIGFSGV